MYIILAERYKNAGIYILMIKTNWWNLAKHERYWSGTGVKNISDLVSTEIYGICETKNPIKEQINEY